MVISSNFYPRSPYGERLRQFRGVFLVGNFYPRSPYGERLVFVFMIWLPRDFYPRSPYGERLFGCWMAANLLLFLSTLSLRRATLGNVAVELPMLNFYPRSPYGERPVFGLL